MTRRRLLSILLAAFMVGTLPIAASASRLATVPLFPSAADNFYCQLANVSTKARVARIRSAYGTLLPGDSMSLFVIPDVGELDVSCSGSTLLTNGVTYRNLSAGSQSWTREIVDQGNGLLIFGGDVGADASVSYESGAITTDYSFHYRQTVHPPAGSPGTTVTYDVTGLI